MSGTSVCHNKTNFAIHKLSLELSSIKVVFFAPWQKAQLQRPVRLVHEGCGNGDGGVVVREAELPQQADHQHVHLYLCKPEMDVETLDSL